MNHQAKCQCCEETSGVESVVIFDVEFTVCAYCRGDAKDTLSRTYIWRRQQPSTDRTPGWIGGCVVVFDGSREVVRRGFGVSDHVG